MPIRRRIVSPSSKSFSRPAFPAVRKMQPPSVQPSAPISARAPMVWCLWKRPDAFCLKKCPLPLWGPAGAMHPRTAKRSPVWLNRSAEKPKIRFLPLWKADFWRLTSLPIHAILPKDWRRKPAPWTVDKSVLSPEGEKQSLDSAKNPLWRENVLMSTTCGAGSRRRISLGSRKC